MTILVGYASHVNLDQSAVDGCQNNTTQYLKFNSTSGLMSPVSTLSDETSPYAGRLDLPFEVRGHG